MIKSISIFISFLVLFQSINIHLDDIIQLDELIKHAQFHKQQYGDNFFVFISKHYGDLKAEHSKKHQEEKRDHENLPFQKHLVTGSTTAIAIRLYPIQMETLSFEIKSEKADNFYYQMPYTSLFKSGVFQPPRHA